MRPHQPVDISSRCRRGCSHWGARSALRALSWIFRKGRIDVVRLEASSSSPRVSHRRCCRPRPNGHAWKWSPVTGSRAASQLSRAAAEIRGPRPNSTRSRPSTREYPLAPGGRRGGGASRPIRTDARSRRCRRGHRQDVLPRRARSESYYQSTRGKDRWPRAARGCNSRPPPTFPLNPAHRLGTSTCSSTKVEQVLDVQQFSNLLSASCVADVLKGEAEVMMEEPEGENPLVDLAHLPWTGDHPAAVHHGRQAESLAYSSIKSSAASSWPRTGCAIHRVGSARRYLRMTRRGNPGSPRARIESDPRSGPARGGAGLDRHGWSRGRGTGRCRDGRARGSCTRR